MSRSGKERRVAAGAAPFLLALSLALLGCGSIESPTDPSRPVVVFEGEITRLETDIHILNVEKEGTVLIELVELRDIDVDEGEEPRRVAIAFALGRVDEEQEEGCRVTFTRALLEGDQLLFNLEARSFCLQLFDTGALFEDQVLAYTLRVTLPT